MIRAAPKLHAILVTYRRPAELRTTLSRLAEQTRQPETLVVIDNGPTFESMSAVRKAASLFEGAVDYVGMSENLGYTGGVKVGMERLLAIAGETDWIVVCDDDDPPASSGVFGRLLRFGEQMIERDPQSAAVGLGGGRFDFRRGRILRVPTNELSGAVPLDYVGGGYFGCYRVSAIREVGTWSDKIFFGFSEGEFGLRLRSAGYKLWGDGDEWRKRRLAEGRGDYVARPARRLGHPGWRRYYSLRNVIWILRQHGRTAAALRVSIVNGIGKPLANLPLTPRVAIEHLRLNVRAIRDAWTDHMGRQIEPTPWGPRPNENMLVPLTWKRSGA